MPMINRMTDLLDKIEQRLGTEPLNLPDKISKDKWAKNTICKATLDTFSRYFPHPMPYVLDMGKKKDGYYLIDEDLCNSVQILGAGDIDWHEFSTRAPAYQYGGGYGTFDLLSSSYDAEDIDMTQMMADHTSLFSNGIYVEYLPPNKIKLTCALSVNTLGFAQAIPITLFVKHANNLMTIHPTKMEVFEKLAIADVATTLYQYLKHYEGVDTVFANTDFKLSTIEEIANTRNDVVQELKESYVSPSNTAQPIMYTIN